MGSYNLKDFVTDLPIIEGDSQTYVLILSVKSLSDYNQYTMNYIDNQFTPISFPLFGEYDGYGRFRLSEEFKEENQFALDFMKSHYRSKNFEVIKDNLIGDQDLEEQGILLSATMLVYYKEVVNYMADVTMWDNVTKDDSTHDVILRNRMEQFGKWLDNVVPEEFNVDDSAVAILQPNVRSTYTQDTPLYSTIDINYEPQKILYEAISENENLFNYITHWLSFYNYLSDVGVSFRPSVRTSELEDTRIYSQHYNMIQTALKIIEEDQYYFEDDWLEE